MPHIILIIYMAAAFLLQVLAGDFPVSFMAFPLNLIFFIIWLTAVLWSWRAGGRSLFVRFMLSPSATLWALGLLLAACLAIGAGGWRWIVSTWPFVAVMLYFQTVLAYVILRGWRRPTATGARLGAVRWRFLFLHMGLLAAVASAFWGAPDTEVSAVQVFRDRAIWEDGALPACDLKLEGFDVEYEDGVPSEYKARLLIDGCKVSVSVNHPYSIGFGTDVYLLNFDRASVSESEIRFCVLEIVREPWKYGAAAGIVMMLAGALMLFIGGPDRRLPHDDD